MSESELIKRQEYHLDEASKTITQMAEERNQLDRQVATLLRQQQEDRRAIRALDDMRERVVAWLNDDGMDFDALSGAIQLSSEHSATIQRAREEA